MTKELRSFKDSVQDGFYPGYFYSDQVENPLAMATMEHTHEAIRTAMDNIETGTVIGTPCGGGKTTTQVAILKEIATTGSVSAVVATDRVDRLMRNLEGAEQASNIINGRNVVANLSDGDGLSMQEVWGAPYKKIVGITPQRILSMDPELLAPIYRDGIKSKQAGEKMYKNFFLCDEAITDVEINDYKLSDLYAFVGHIRESISPEKEGDIEDGQIAKRAGDLAEKLLELVKNEIDRINSSTLRYRENEKKEDRTRPDVFGGYFNICKRYSDSLLDLINSLKDMVEILKKKGRIKESSTRKSALEKIIEGSAKVENNEKFSEIQTWTNKVREFRVSTTAVKYLTEVNLGEIEVKIDCLEHLAELKTAPAELAKICKNNKKNMRENSGGCENIISAEEFLSVFDLENVVIMNTVRKGRSKIDNRPQVTITVGRYTLNQLPWGKMPIIIADGTGHLNPAYRDGRYKFDFIGDFYKPHIPVRIVQYGEISGAYDLKKDNQVQAKNLFSHIKEILGENLKRINPTKTLVTCYKELVPLMKEYGLAPGVLSDLPAKSFGSVDLTGSNDYKDRSVIVKIGQSTISQFTSFVQTCCRKPEIWGEIVNMETVERQTLLRTIYNYNATAENCRYYEIIRKNQVDTACKDIVQEFQRLRIRNFPASEDLAELRRYGISILWFSRGHAQGIYNPEKETLSEEIVRRILEELGCDADRDYIYHAPVLNEYKNDDKAPSLIIEYYKKLAAGAEYTYPGIAKKLNIPYDIVKQTFCRNKILKNLVKNDTVIQKGKCLIRVKAGSAKTDLMRVLTAYRKYNYGEKYSYVDIAAEAEVTEGYVEQVFRYSVELKKFIQYDDILPNGGICKNPEKEELVKAEAYVEKRYRETPLLEKYSVATMAADTGFKKTLVAQILNTPYMMQLRAADRKMGSGCFRKQAPEAQQLSLF
jgi:hypothetical protein